jgi:hypothetical protein
VAELLLLGVTHYPPLCGRDEDMAGIHRRLLADPAVPADEKDPANWPEPQQREWGDDEGRSSAAAHRAQLVAGFDEVRAALEAFDPDAVLIWGDDQYENFREDLIPPYALLAYGDLEAHPWAGRKLPNAWDEPSDAAFKVKGHPEMARWLAEALLEDGVDVAYAYQPRHHPDLAHAFLNAIMFLDYHRHGFPWPVVAMPVNCYGRRVISANGMWKPFGTELVDDPPAPSPRRLMDVGAAVARALRRGPYRVALLASSSWSHAFLTDHTWRLRPDTAADRKLYEALAEGDFATWEATPLAAVEHAGQQEVLNWFCLMGAARELGATPPAWSTFVETWVFNSNKVFAIWEPR